MLRNTSFDGKYNKFAFTVPYSRSNDYMQSISLSDSDDDELEKTNLSDTITMCTFCLKKHEYNTSCHSGNSIYLTPNDDLSLNIDLNQTICNTISKPIDIPKQPNDMNYSIYVDKITSYSPKSIDKSVNLKINEKWVDSNIINKCQNCENVFSLLLRKHHCRACGSVYCYKCCNKYINIPTQLITKPKEDYNYKSFIFNKYRTLCSIDVLKSPQLVCNDCDTKITRLLSVDHLIKIFVYLSLKDLYNAALVNKDYNIAARYYINKFRDIQYKNIQNYNNWDNYILWNTREYILNHNIWISCLIKSIYSTINKIGHISNYNLNKLEWIYQILDSNTSIIKIKCWSLLCSRRCNINLDTDDIINLLESITFDNLDFYWNCEINCKIILKLVQLLMNKIHNKKHIYIPILCKIFTELFETINFVNDIVFLNKILATLFCNKDISLGVLIIFEQNYIYNIDNTNYVFFKHAILYIESIFGSTLIDNILQMIESIKSIANGSSVKLPSIKPFINPFNISETITSITQIITINSNTKPILVIANSYSNDTKVNRIFKFIIKNDKNLRKEQLVSCLINVLQYKLYCKNDLVKVPTYQIILLSKTLGLIEYIEDSITLRMISESGLTLQNYILGKNPNSTIQNVKHIFVNSLSISSAISYIIGLGDRHLDNIMIHKDGMIFNIDYGYILDAPLTLFEMPQIKVTNDIIDFLEGRNSNYYIEFKKNVILFYNILRANKHIIYQYFQFIADEGFLNWNNIQSKLDARIMNGIKYKDIEVILINEIESSNSLNNIIADLCHMYKYKLLS